MDAPEALEAIFGTLPQGATLSRDLRDHADLIIWFVPSRAALERRIDKMASRAGASPVWIAWPKKASGVKSDLSQQVVRRTAGAAGLVDYKIIAIDETWSGLLFTRRPGAPKR